jgi:hypothetical protein
MKKLIAAFLCIPSLYALYLGNPAEPQIIDEGFFISQDSLFSVKVGYQGDFVFDRKLRAFDGATGRIDRFNIWMNQGVLTLNILDRFEAYASVGSITTSFWDRPHIDHQRREYETHDKWTAGGGLKLIVMQWGNTVLGADGKLQYGAPHIKWATVDGISYATGARVVYREWQVGLAVSHTVDLFTPYIGATYSHVKGEVEHLSHTVYPRSHFKFRCRDHFGMAVGCSLSSGKKVDLNLEARMFSEQAVTGAANVKF